VPTIAVFSAHTKASRDAPAYFIIKSSAGPVILHTSSSADWVIEYIDDRGVLHMENDNGEQSPEKAEFISTGKTVYVKVYPYKYADSMEVFLYAENVNSLMVSPTVPQPFAATATPTTTATPQSGPFPLIGLIALGIMLLLARK
jgi:hypothetical protein